MGNPQILLVTFPAQGHINPALQFAKRLVAFGAHVTFSTSIAAERRMDKTGASVPPGLSFSAFHDGTEHSFRPTDDIDHYMFQLKRCGSNSLAQLIVDSAEAGHPFTCVVYSNLIPWVGKVARDFQLPSFLLWNQSATVFDVFFHYFNGFDDAIKKSIMSEDAVSSLKLPGLSVPFASHDLPSFFSPDNRHTFGLKLMKEQLEILDQETSPPKVLVNTFDPLESEALNSVSRYNLVGVGPLLPSAFLDGKDPSDNSFGGDLFRASKDDDYMKWLDSQPESSVIYISFGSVSVVSKKEKEEIARALLDVGRPFLWVIRSTNAGSEEKEEEELDKPSCIEELKRQGKIVPWCSQVQVLSHPSLGCFVTHCGWNSTLESLSSGVPVVALPRWTDQLTNAKLVNEVWKTGVRVKSTGAERVFEAAEIRRCLELVMGNEEQGQETRRNARKWKRLARETSKETGLSYTNLKAFVNDIPRVH